MLTESQRKAINFLRAIKSHKGILKLGDYANKVGESEAHLGQIGLKLKSAGLVLVKRGPGGGYSIHPEKRFITLLEVMEAITSRREVKPCEIQRTINDALSRVIVA